MKKKGGLWLAVLAAAALLAVGCQPLANTGGKWNPKGEHYIKLAINVPEQGRAITVTDYQVTGLSIEVRDPDSVVVYSDTWDASQGDTTEMIPVEKTGEYEITVTHFGEQGGQSVEATETATFTIGAMVITVVEVVPGSVGTISVVGGTTPATHTVSGKLIDGGTGAPLAGGTIEFAGHSATSGADGSYSLDLGQSTGTVTGTLAVHAAGFVTDLFEGVSADASGDSTARLVLQRTDNTGLPRHDVRLHIYELQSSPSPTEIPDGTPIFISVFNENGAGEREWRTYNAGGYQLYNHVSGSCVVAVYVDLSAVPGMHSFNVIKENVSVPAVIPDIPDVVLNEDPGSEATMTISGDAALNQATLYLDFPNGVIPVLDLTLNSSAQATLQFSNPNGYEGYWTQAANPSAFGPLTFSCSALAPIAANVTLPAIPSFGAPPPPDSSTLAYDSGILSIGPVAGATQYNFWVMDSSNNLRAIISGVGPSVALPAWLQTQLAGATMMMMPSTVATNLTSIDITALPIMLLYAGAVPSVEIAIAMGAPNYLTF